MLTHTMWTRRKLLKVSGLGVGAGFASGLGVAGAAEPPVRPQAGRNALVFVASAARDSGREGVEAFAVRNGLRQPLHFVSSARPSSLTLAPGGETLYVTNSLETYGGLPTGSVEAWAIDPRSGRLKLLNRQGLALAAIHPTHAAVSPDASLLAVSAAGGASCVLMPLGRDGSLGEPVAVRKELRLAAPARLPPGSPAAQLCFASDRRLIVADFSERHLSTYTCGDAFLQIVDRVALPPAGVSASFETRDDAVEIRLHDASQQALQRMIWDGERLVCEPDVFAWKDPAQKAAAMPWTPFDVATPPVFLHRHAASRDGMVGQGIGFLQQGDVPTRGTSQPQAFAWVQL